MGEGGFTPEEAMTQPPKEPPVFRYVKLSTFLRNPTSIFPRWSTGRQESGGSGTQTEEAGQSGTDLRRNEASATYGFQGDGSPKTTALKEPSQPVNPTQSK